MPAGRPTRRACARPTTAAIAALASAEGTLAGVLGRLMAVVEAYPELKADATMRELSEELAHTENRIAFARQAFNDAVLDYNNAAQQAPANLVAGAVQLQAGGDARIDPQRRRAPGRARQVLSMRFRRHREAAENATWGMLLGFAAALVFLVVAVNLALALALKLTLPIFDGYPRLFFETNTALILLFVLGGCWIESLRMREGGAHVARMAGARPADASGSSRDGLRERRLVNVVQEMALAARARPPAVWVLPRDPNINAFAAGWTADDAVVAVTQGALERLTRAELQGLVGHEMGHIVSGDTRLNTRLIGLVWGLQMVHGFGHSLAARDEHGRWHAAAIVGVALIVVGYLGWLAGRVLQAGVSRQREFGADASAVQYVRTVDGIGGVLRKIAGSATDGRARARPTPWRTCGWRNRAAPGTGGWRHWLATHPPIGQRLKRLYGRDIGLLDAPLLPPPTDAEEPMLSFAAPLHAAPGARAMPIAAHDLTTSAAAFASALAEVQDERDALLRASFWRSRGECHAALLAWLIGDACSPAAWASWRALVGNSPYVERLRADWIVLGSAARWQVFDTLVTHTRATPAADRAALVRAARSLAPRGAARLRRMLLLRQLRGKTSRPGTQPLEALSGAVACAASLIAPAMGPAGAGWAAAVGAVADATPRGALGLRRLHAMQRPRVARAWVDAATGCGLLRDHPPAADLLVAACRLLETPPPRALLGERPQAAARGSGDGRGQHRILS